MAVQCPNGHDVPPGQNFCGECGAELLTEAAPSSTSDSTQTQQLERWWQSGQPSPARPQTPVAPSLPPEVKVKKYRNTAAANRAARSMAAQGWQPQGMAGGGTRLSLGKAVVNKGIAAAFFGPLGLFASSRVEEPVTVTWTRTGEAAAAALHRRQEAQAAAARRSAQAAAKRAEAKRLREETKAQHQAAKREQAEADRLAKSERDAALAETKHEKEQADQAVRAEKDAARRRAKEQKQAERASVKEQREAARGLAKQLASGTTHREQAATQKPWSPTDHRTPGDTWTPPLPQTPNPPAGWHSDPLGQARLRWWDGQQWTDHTTQ